MTDELEVRPGFTVAADELTWRFSRSSGPGGQSVNTSDSRVSLSYDVALASSVPEHLRIRLLQRLAPRLVGGVLTVHADTERSQLQNRRVATRRLVELLRQASEPPPRKRRPTRPSAGATADRLKGKKLRSQTKQNRRTPTDD